MKGKYPLTRARLHRALLELLQHPEVHLTLAPMKDGGRCDWDDICPPTNIRIRVDANTGDDVEFVIHELLHVILYPMVMGRLDSTLEEVLVVPLAAYMWEFVHSNANRERHWRAIIKKKVDAELVEVPYEDRVDRTQEDRKEGIK